MAIEDTAAEESGVLMSRSLGSDLAARKSFETAPEDRISLVHKLIYGLGAFVNNLLAAAIGGTRRWSGCSVRCRG